MSSSAFDFGIDVSDADRAFAIHVSALGNEDAKYNTICLVKRALAEGVPGDFVECGAHDGGQPALMGYALARYGGPEDAHRRVHLFDSFECHPKAGLRDDASVQIQLGVNDDPTVGISSGIFLCSLEHTQENIAKWGAPTERMVYHKGWLQEVLPKIADAFPAIALLRVDVDLHDSTVPVFKYLYDKVSPGGYIVSDDWGGGDGYDACRAAVLEFFVARDLPRPIVTRLPSQSGTVWWRKP